MVVLAILLGAGIATTGPSEAAEPSLGELVEFVLLSPQPASADIMNDEIPHVLVLGDQLAVVWESDYTHWLNPDGTSPVEYPENEDILVRFFRDGQWTDIFNVSTDGLPFNGYGHRSGAVVFQGKLHVFWNSHAWSDGGSFSVIMRIYDPATDSWDEARAIIDTPPDGIDAGASAAVHDGKLWWAWQSRRPAPDNGTDPGIEVHSRWYDGSQWGPVVSISRGEPGSDTEPSVRTSGGTVHVAWSHDDPVTPGNPDIHYCSLLPDGTWSEVTHGLGNGPDRGDKKVKLFDWNGAVGMVWQSDGISQRGNIFSDVMLNLQENGEWGPARVVSVQDREKGNTNPDPIIFRDMLYIAWTTTDDGITTGTDRDVVMRDFDGERFGDIVGLSPVDTQMGPNQSDEGSVELAVFDGNIYAVFDAIYSPLTDGPNKDILFRYVGYDLDGDGHDDLVDEFPRDPEEHVDTDGDGVGDNADAFPRDPTRWEPEDEDEEGSMLLALASIAAVVIVLLAIIVHQRRGIRRALQTGDGQGPPEPTSDEDEASKDKVT
jgi:hypothetical protein